MHLAGPGVAQHADDLGGRVASHDRVIDHDEAAALDNLLQRVELGPDALLADELGGLDEGPAHVAVLHQALAVGDPGRRRVAGSGRGCGLGHAHHQVRLDGRLLGEALAHLVAGLVHALAEELGVGPGEVDELEDAQRRGGRSEPAGPESARVDDDQLAGLDLPDERRSDDVERAGLGGKRVALLQAPEHQRPQAVGVPGPEKGDRVHQDQREGSRQRREHLHDRLLGVLLAAVGDQGGDDVAVGGGVGPEGVRRPTRQLGQLPGVDQVAVVAEGDLEVAGGLVGGLGVLPEAGARRRVADVPDGDVARQRGELLLVEDLGDQAHVLVDDDRGALGDRDARRLLAAVLEGEQTVVGEVGCLHSGGMDADDPAGFLRAVRMLPHGPRVPDQGPGYYDPPACNMARGNVCS